MVIYGSLNVLNIGRDCVAENQALDNRHDKNDRPHLLIAKDLNKFFANHLFQSFVCHQLHQLFFSLILATTINTTAKITKPAASMINISKPAPLR